MTLAPTITLYRSLGWATIRVQPLGKAPIGHWQDRTDEPSDFAAGDNVGVRLGAPSGDLVDVDLDAPQAVVLAPRFLPATATFGRGGERRHYLYRCATPTKKPGRTHIELRSTGGQTVFPGSMHPSGVPIEWYCFPTGGPTAIAEPELLAAFGRLCAATIIARVWPGLVGNKHDAVLAFAGALWHSGWRLEDALDLLLPAMELDGSREPHREQAIRDTWAGDREQVYGWPTVKRLLGDADAQALERAVELVGVTPQAVHAPSGDDQRPEVDLAADQLDVLTAIGDALVQRPGTHGLYRQGDALVTIDGPATAHRVAVELARAIRFTRQTKTARVPAHVPLELASKVCADPPALAELLGRRTTPVVRADGSVGEARGYDVAARVWCDGWSDPRVPAFDAVGAGAAVGRLLAFVHAGQWTGDADMWAWVAHVLTVASRTAIAGPVPAWVYSAAMSGSGKTALARVAGIIGGGCADVTSPGLRDEDELARRLDAHASASAVVLDNMHGVLRSETLEGAVTGGVLAVRRLYVGPVRVPWRTVLAVTSNGATIGHDWVRRTLPVRLNSAKLPAARDVVAEAAGRPDLTADAVGVVASYLRSGAPATATPLLGFTDWSRVVGGALAWACPGVDVVLATRDASADMVATEDDGTELLDVIERWLVNTGRTEFSAKEIYDAPPMMDLRGEYPDANALGRRLARCGDQTRVLSKRKTHGTLFWRVERRGGG